MITVWCVLNGDKYRDADAHILREMCEKHLEQPFRFRCLADREISGIETFIPDEQWPGWWSKLLLFRYASGQNLYLDLDTVVVGNLDRLVSKQLSMPANWAQSGWGGCQSSVMSWDGDYSFIPNFFDVSLLQKPENGNCGRYKGLWGDQELITSLLGDPGDKVKPMRHVYSYKYHCRDKPPEDASVVCFHGDPKPAQVNAQWIQAARLSTATGD